MKLLKESVLNKIQVAAEVNAALTEYSLVVVTKHRHPDRTIDQGDLGTVYDVYACQGELVAGQVQELEAASNSK